VGKTNKPLFADTDERIMRCSTLDRQQKQQVSPHGPISVDKMAK